MGLETAVGSLILILKNACFNVTVALTVLVALGNEVRRWRVSLKWLEERHEELKRAWGISLGLYLLLSLLYAWLERKPEALIVDGITMALMVAAVWYLNRRKGAKVDPASTAERRASLLGDEDEDDFATPRTEPERVPRDRGRRERRQRRERVHDE